MHTRRKIPKVFHVLKFMLLGALFLTALGLGVRELWNCLIPDLFHGPVITFWQALGLCLLGKLLFGWHGGGSSRWGVGAKEQWRKKMKARMEHMTDEEKEKLRERFKRCMPDRYNRWRDNDDWNEGTKDTQTKPETNL
ncbi:hypothetical protein SAMN05518672_101566 [Chitinophaga sp. CF118]|uniref:hypothetical protein n=1 Tax=Chitinophaga sp. CF118 TaxID=1884367 RepID=UPI0008EA9AB7|nr:hypothetical protein [Chitinophaga sp. CF118]SFD11930.1 hypothetical protein SAMN05518672_101566 [Chitinophaga sp. CF118]